MMTFAKILLGVDNRRNKQKEKEEREKKSKLQVPRPYQKKHSVPIT